jgi:phosphoglycolate phosphatase-like HAD superfamily hydrolase
VKVIAGQELGKKALHLELAARGRYASDHILMIGDAPGDMRAARANDALFYAINPGHEEESWQRFYEEAMLKFLAGEYAGAYEAAVIAEFEKMLPEVPPWKR